MTLDEIIEFCSDEDNLQFTFDFSIFWMLEEVPDFFKTIQRAIYRWDMYVENYLDGETISIEYNGELFEIAIKFNTNNKTFVISN